jgi:hypothetical protein
MIINNFRKTPSIYSKRPPYLVEFFIHKGFVIYSSNYNALVYIIYNPNEKEYHAFENQGSDDIKNDLIQNIEYYFIKTV